MSSGRTLSHHMLRRTARAKKHWLAEIQSAAAVGNPIARKILEDYGIGEQTRLAVESTLRGPFGWRVVTR